MMALKARLNQKSEELFASRAPPTRKDIFRVVYDMFTSNDRAIRKQYEVWKTLSDAALAYSTADSRKAAVDLDTLAQMQNFESVSQLAFRELCCSAFLCIPDARACLSCSLSSPQFRGVPPGDLQVARDRQQEQLRLEQLHHQVRAAGRQDPPQCTRRGASVVEEEIVLLVSLRRFRAAGRRRRL